MASTIVSVIILCKDMLFYLPSKCSDRLTRIPDHENPELFTKRGTKIIFEINFGKKSGDAAQD